MRLGDPVSADHARLADVSAEAARRQPKAEQRRAYCAPVRDEQSPFLSLPAAVLVRTRLGVRSGEGFRAPALCDGWTCARGRRPKASQGGNRGKVGGPFGERAYGDLRVADGRRARRRRPAAFCVVGGSGDGGGFRWRRCAGARRSHRSKEDWRACAGVVLVFRRAAGGEGDRRCEAGRVATVMSCRS
jgi:hypothetical protein